MAQKKGWTVIMTVFVLLAGALQFLPAPVGAVNDPAQPAEGGTAYVTGDWTVDSVREYHNCTIVVTGDLIVASGGDLTLNNVTLKMNSSTGGEFGIVVDAGGALRVHKGSVITATNGANHFTFEVLADATLDMDDATLSECGVSGADPIEEVGLYLASGDVRINDTTINNNGYGMIIDSVDITFTNSTVKNSIGNGAYFWNVGPDTVIFNVTLSFNGIYGLSLIFCEDVYLEEVNVSRNTFDGFGAYQTNATLERVSSYRNSRLGILAQSSNFTVYNSSFTKNTMCDVYLTGHNATSMTGSGNIELVDVMYGSYHLHDWTQGLNESYHLNVSARWLDEGAIPGAKVTIYNNSGTSDGEEAYNGTTDPAGNITGILLRVRQDGPIGFAVHGPHTFEAEKDGRNGTVEFNVSAPWQTVVIDIDRTPPVLDITSPGDGSLFNHSDVTVTGTASDHDGIALVEVTWNGTGGWSPATGTLSWSKDLDLPDGDHRLEVRALDGSGASSNASVNVTIDTTPPIITITSPAMDELTKDRTTMVTGTTEPGVAITTGGGSQAVINDNGTFGFKVDLIEGKNTIQVSVEDLARNMNATEVTVYLDTVGPEINVTWPPPGFGTKEEIVEVSGSVHGADHIGYTLGDFHFNTTVHNNIFSHFIPLTEGTNDILLRAWDLAGNDITEVVTVIMDTTEPPLVVDWPLDNLTNQRFVTINISTEAGANLTVNGEVVENDDGEVQYIHQLDMGVNILTFTAKDRLSNSNTTSFEVEVDYLPPQMSIDRPAEGDSLSSRRVNIFGTASDDMLVTRVEFRADHGNWTDCSGTETWFTSRELGPGDHTIVVRAWDLAGNHVMMVVNFTVLEDMGDERVPEIEITWPKEGSTIVAGDVTFTGAAFDDVGIEKVEWSLDGQTWSECNGTAYWSKTLTLAKGSYTVHFRATDEAGKTNLTSLTIKVRSGHTKEDTDLLASGLGSAWVVALLAVMILLVAIYFVVSTARSKKAIEDEERLERGDLDKDEDIPDEEDEKEKDTSEE